MNSKESSFFSSVAKYNHERFHSEVITWCFNFNNVFAEKFIKEITGIDLIEIPKELVKSEEDSVDIKLKFEFQNKQYTVFIENKVKATEHLIDSEKFQKLIIEQQKKKKLNSFFEKNKEKIDRLKNKKLSQTEYYYLKNELSKKDKENFYYVYLKPCIIENFTNAPEYINSKKYNEWGNLTNLEIENPWKTIAYFELAKFMQTELKNNDAKSVIYNSYHQFITNEEYFPTREISHSLLIYTEKNVNDFKVKYLNFEYFKLLNYFLYKKCISLNGNLYNEFKAGSERNGSPLINIYTLIHTPAMQREYFKKNELSNELKIGVQIQGNSLKYFMEAANYQEAIIKNDDKVNFRKFCHTTILRHLEKSKTEISKTSSTSKSFNTYTEGIELSNVNNTADNIFNIISPYLKSIQEKLLVGLED